MALTTHPRKSARHNSPTSRRPPRRGLLGDTALAPGKRHVGPEVSVYRPNLSINHHNRLDASLAEQVSAEALSMPEVAPWDLPSMPKCARRALKALSNRAWVLWVAKGADAPTPAQVSFSASRKSLMEICGLSKDLYYSAIAFLSLTGHVTIYNTGYSGGRWTWGKVVCAAAPEAAGETGQGFADAARAATSTAEAGVEPQDCSLADSSREALADVAGALWRAREARCGAQAMDGAGPDGPDRVCETLSRLLEGGLIADPKDAVVAFELYCRDQDGQGVPVRKTAHLATFLDPEWTLGVTHYLSLVHPPEISPAADDVLEEARRRAQEIAAKVPQGPSLGGSPAAAAHKGPQNQNQKPSHNQTHNGAKNPREKAQKDFFETFPQKPLTPGQAIDLSKDGPIAEDEVLAMAYFCLGCGFEVADDVWKWMERTGWRRNNGQKVTRRNLIDTVGTCARRDHGHEAFALPVKTVHVVSYPDQRTYEDLRPKGSPERFEDYNRALLEKARRAAMKGAYWPKVLPARPDAFRSVSGATIDDEQRASWNHASAAGLL